MDNLELNNHFKQVTNRFDNIKNTLASKKSSVKNYNIYFLGTAINGFGFRLNSINYHIELIQREIYLEKDKVVLSCKDKDITLINSMISGKFIKLIMHRTTILLCDIINDFFGALDNMAKIITQFDKTSHGMRRMSDLISGLNKQDHSKKKKFVLFLTNEWDTWISKLYLEYRNDVIHFNPEECNISSLLKMNRIDGTTDGSCTAEQDILISLPNTIKGIMNYDENEDDLLNFCFDIEERLLNIIEETIKLL